MTPTPEPTAARPQMPPGYGLPPSSQGLLSRSVVEQRLRTAQLYWLSTVRPDGTPHCVPRWGVWLDNRFYSTRMPGQGRTAAACA